jgi:hypothetical protein
MAAAVVPPAAGQIWRDDCYYLDRATGQCQRKYMLVLAVDPRSSDMVTAVFTSKANGLVDSPACNLGPPRSGYYVGVPGGVLQRPSWVDFNSLQDLDAADLSKLQRSGRLSLVAQILPVPVFCAVLRCVQQSDDLTGRQARLIGDVAAALGCA